MSLWQLLFLGILQGLTEFLPISSSAHLRVFPSLFGWPDPGASFTAILQLGSLLAVLFYFRKECFELLQDGIQLFAGKKPGTQFLAILVGTIPIGVCGFLLRHWIRGSARSLWIVSAALILVGVLLWIIESRARAERDESSLRVKDGFWMGCAQAFALIPGVSRSGASIGAGFLLGFSRETAARLSFLLGIPALFAAGVFEIWEIRSQLNGENLNTLIFGTAVSFVSSYLTIWGFLRFVKKHRMRPFLIYRVLLGIFLLGLLFSGQIESL